MKITVISFMVTAVTLRILIYLYIYIYIYVYMHRYSSERAG
jgi:hypothetical protein